jgi:DNA-binding LytR/AlgR family response regulator
MNAKLKCVIVDDDIFSIENLKDLCKNSPYVEIAYSFTSPERFLETRSTLNYDFCLFDIVMPEIDGFTLCSMVDKPVILITGVVGKLVDAIDLTSPIDVLRKPIKRERLEIALKKMHKLLEGGYLKEDSLNKTKEYELFNNIDPGGKIRIKLSDILYVKTQPEAHRNKYITLKGGNRYLLSDISFEELLTLSSNLIRINKSELISIEAFHKIENDVINLKGVVIDGNPKKVYLNRWFKKDFFNRIST